MENSKTAPVTVGPQDGQNLSVVGDTYRILITGKETGGAYAAIDMLIPPNGGPGPHSHANFQESFYVIDGEIEVQADGNRSRVRSGGMSFVPKGIAHAFIVVSAEARLITIQSPAAVGQAFYRGASEPAVDDTTDVVDFARIQASAAENPRGITILGPPPFATAAAR